MTNHVHRRVGLYLGTVQFFFALSWTVYVIFLPQLAARAGLPPSAVIWLLMLDQLVFLVADYACGVASDRMAEATGRFGMAVLAATLLSCLAFVALPWVAPAGSPALMVALMAVWAATSAALRAPPMNLIGRHATRPAQPSLVAASMLGLGVAGALAPYVGLVLRELDPRWPFVLSSLALVATTGGIVVAERLLLRQRADGKAAAGGTGATEPGAASAASPGGPDASAAAASAARDERRALALRDAWPGALLAAVLAALAFQLHVFLNSGPLYQRVAGSERLAQLAPVFWIGFNVGLWPASVATRRWGGLAVAGVAGAGAALAAALAVASGTLPLLVAAQCLAGLAWAGVLCSAFSAALAFGHTGREGRCSGALSSVLALAALLRMGALAGGLAAGPLDAGTRALLLWAPMLLWGVAGLLLLGLLWRRRERPAAAVPA